MNRDEVFSAPEKAAWDFEFNADVAHAFDDMLERSVPFYQEQQRMIRTMSKSFWVPGTQVYDLGLFHGNHARRFGNRTRRRREADRL